MSVLELFAVALLAAIGFGIALHQMQGAEV